MKKIIAILAAAALSAVVAVPAHAGKPAERPRKAGAVALSQPVVRRNVVPNVLGMNRADAEATLNAAGYYNLHWYDNKSGTDPINWCVLWQSPAGGTTYWPVNEVEVGMDDGIC